MEVRTGRIERSRGLFFAIAFLAPAFLAGCATSRTHLDWGVREVPRHRVTVAARPYTPTRYAPQARVVPTPRPAPAWYKDTRPVQSDTIVVNTPVVTDTHFAWPMSGRVISDFGSTIGGERNDGINIAAVNGEPIHAAADGVVTYTGNDLKSYGNLVLIRHGDNYVTAYAHADRIVIGRGDHVVKGQVIGYAGNTGDVSSPQLHFEIRRGVTPINPRPLLGPLLVASR